MRVLLVSNLFPNPAQPHKGLFNLQQVLALAKTDEVRVVAPVQWVPRWPWLRRVGGWTALADIPEREVREGLEVWHPRYLVIPTLSRPWNGWLFARGMARTVWHLAQTFQPDVILATWLYPDVFAAARLGRQLGIPVIGKLHGSDVHVLAQGWWRRRAARAAVNGCRRLVAVSEAIKQDLVTWGVRPERVAVISNGVDEARFRPQDRAASRRQLGLPADGRLIVFVGNLVAVKGVGSVLEAIASPGQTARLVIVGQGTDEAALHARARALGIVDRVVFAGARPHAEIPLWLNAADVLCLPSVSEGCPNVVVEALACGTPVVATRTGGVPALVRDGLNGFVVPVGDIPALSAALERALGATWAREAIHATVRGRGWQDNAQQLHQALGEAVGEAPSPTILHVLRYSIPNLSGYTVRSQALIEGQRAHGVHPVVVTSVRHDAPADLETINGIRYHRCRVSAQPVVQWLQTRVPLVRTLATMASLARTIERVARAEGARLIHAHSPVMCAFPALVAARRLRLPLVYEVRALWEDAAVDQEKTTEGSVAYRLARALETFVLRRADRVVVICEGLRRELMARGLAAERMTVSPNGVDPAAFAPLSGKDPALVAQYHLNGRKVIGFIGSFFQFEGLECLLRAVPHLRRLDSTIQIVIVGGGERERALRQQAQADGLDGAVLFTGRVPHEQVRAYYSIMDALIYPRLSRRITELVTPLKPLEAMALQRPVIASDVGGLRELVTDGETGVLFQADDPEALAEACVRLLRNPDLAQRVARQGRAFVEQERSWDTICARSAALYQELLAA